MRQKINFVQLKNGSQGRTWKDGNVVVQRRDLCIKSLVDVCSRIDRGSRDASIGGLVYGGGMRGFHIFSFYGPMKQKMEGDL